MKTQAAQKSISLWIIFLLTAFSSGFFTFINMSEFVKIGILGKTAGYPFGGEGPAPWYYKSAQVYAFVNLIFVILFLGTLGTSCWMFFKSRKSLIYMFFVTIVLNTVQLVV